MFICFILKTAYAMFICLFVSSKDLLERPVKQEESVIPLEEIPIGISTGGNSDYRP